MLVSQRAQDFKCIISNERCISSTFNSIRMSINIRNNEQTAVASKISEMLGLAMKASSKKFNGQDCVE